MTVERIDDVFQVVGVGRAEIVSLVTETQVDALKDRTVRQAINLRLSLTEFPSVQHHYTGRLFSPRILYVRYSWRDDDAWFMNLTLSGPIIKSDGKPGVKQIFNELYSARSMRAGHEKNPETHPDWLVELVEHLQIKDRPPFVRGETVL